ncbi:hypothetical protein BC941DRAFT_512101 [Chlamydoabsidia padenii]|nr:hypothetical protein BC941DRAFT_512101 [Chlamydoabsidia padenii]
MNSNITMENDIHHSIKKVKLYYSFKGSKTMRLATFQIEYDHDTTTSNSSLVTVPLKNCLIAICSSSPDIICHEHDLSVYSVNFQESENSHQSPGNQIDKADNLIWEGHGLMSWVMDGQDTNKIQVSGKLNQQHIDVYVELQPTIQWCKAEFYNSLQSQDFNGFKHASPSSARHSSSTHPCNCGIHATIYAKQQEHKDDTNANQYLKRRRLTPPPTPLSKTTTSPTLPPLYSNVKSSSLLSPPPRLPSPSNIISTASLSPPSSLFRPEPILPSPDSCRRSVPPQGNPNYYMDERHYHHQQQQQPTNTLFSRQTPHDHPMHHSSFHPPSRSAFTPTIIHHSDYPSSSPVNRPYHSYPSQHSLQHQTMASIIPPSDIPVVYAPSNKKRKKYPPMIMSADDKKSSTQPHTKSQQMQQQQQHMQQQVSTAVRTYYEVDRDDHGQYILPVEIDSWTVVDLGTVVYDRPAYHNQRYIYPVNYTVRKWYRSMVDAKSDTQYTCRILDNGREPKFEVTADDCPITYSGPTPTTIWTIVVKRAFAIRHQEYGHNPVGPDFFGLRKNTIAKMIQDLPNVDKCPQYVWQNFEPARFNKPGRNRRRLDTMISGSILGGVNYSLTSGRLNTAASHQQHQLQIQQRRMSSALGVTGTIETNITNSSDTLSSSSSDSASSHADSPPTTAAILPPPKSQHEHHYGNISSTQSYLQAPSFHNVSSTTSIKTTA